MSHLSCCFAGIGLLVVLHIFRPKTLTDIAFVHWSQVTDLVLNLLWFCRALLFIWGYDAGGTGWKRHGIQCQHRWQ